MFPGTLLTQLNYLYVLPLYPETVLIIMTLLYATVQYANSLPEK